MGFSLTVFFNDLREIAENGDIDDAERLERYEQCIQDAEQYARDCGQVV